MKKLLAAAVLGLAVGVVVSFSWIAAAQDGVGDPVEMILEANRLFDRWSAPFDFATYGDPLRRAIELWERALPLLLEENVQSRSSVLNSLSQAYFELGEGYLADAREKETAYEAGRDAALASLRLDPSFIATEKAEGFRAALRSANDIEAIFWYGNTLGQWLSYHTLTAILGGVKDVYACFERALELNEAYQGAGPHRAMGSFLAQAYFLVGRDRAECVGHFERCIELAPNHFEGYVSYAEQYVRSTGDEDLFDSLIGTVLAKAEDPVAMAAFPFYNRLSLDRANALVSQD